MTEQPKKRTRRTKLQMEMDQAKKLEDMHRGNNRQRDDSREERPQIRQMSKKPLKLDVEVIKNRLEEKLGKRLQLKWARFEAVPDLQSKGWSVVDSNMRNQVQKYTPDGRLRSENVQDAEGGALTAPVGNGEYNFLMYKDLELYLQEDAVWNKQQADAPMDAIQSASVMGARAGLGDEVDSYQPKQQVKIEKQREAY